MSFRGIALSTMRKRLFGRIPITSVVIGLIGLILLAAAGFVIVSVKMGKESLLFAKGGMTAGPNINHTAPPRPEFDYVHRYRLSSQVNDALAKVGDRLEKPGKERLVMSGSLSRGDNQAGNPMKLILELPHRLRIEEQQGSQTHILGFDGHQAWSGDSAVSQRDKDIIESLVFDSADHYFIGQTQGFATQEIGPRFREDDGTAANYSGPFYDVYQVYDQIQFGTTVRKQTKFYYINSDTLLLERVRYVDNQQGSPVKVEIRIGGWHKVENQFVPGYIARLENGERIFYFIFVDTVIGAAAHDGIFGQP